MTNDEENPVMKEWWEQVEFFKKYKERFIKIYDEDDYLAIYNQRVVASGKNEIELIRKMRREYPGKVGLIAPIAERIIDIPTPEFLR